MSDGMILLRHLAETAALPGLAFDDDGLAALAFASGVNLTLKHLPEDDALIAFSVIGTLDVDRRDEMMPVLLRANRFWRGTGGATLSLDDDTPPRVIIAARWPVATLTPAHFVEAVEQLADTAADWREVLAATSSPGLVGGGANAGVFA
jgi:hypothetical protein